MLAAAFFTGAASSPPSSDFFAAVFLAGAFLAGFSSSGCLSRFSPSRSALRRTRSACASSMDDDVLFTSIPIDVESSSISLFVIIYLHFKLFVHRLSPLLERLLAHLVVDVLTYLPVQLVHTLLTYFLDPCVQITNQFLAQVVVLSVVHAFQYGSVIPARMYDSPLKPINLTPPLDVIKGRMASTMATTD